LAHPFLRNVNKEKEKARTAISLTYKSGTKCGRACSGKFDITARNIGLNSEQ